jgi:hypothetical protein
VRVRGADDTHKEHSCVLSPHGADRGGLGEVQHDDYGGRVHQVAESELSFLQIRATMLLQETICQVKAVICENRKQIAHTRLESMAGAVNLYSLMQLFRRGHQVMRNRATVYVTCCQAIKITPRTHTNCTNKIPAELNGNHLFVDPISFVIKVAPVRCNNIAPPRWRLNGRWYCVFT